jgi:hypothetical protein
MKLAIFSLALLAMADLAVAGSLTEVSLTGGGLRGLSDINQLAGDLGSSSLQPGSYAAAAALTINGRLTLVTDNYAEGEAPSWTFKVTGALTSAAASDVVFVVGGTPHEYGSEKYQELAAQVSWDVTGAITLGADSTMAGGMESDGAITLGAGAKNGSNLKAGGALTLGAGAISGALDAVGTITLGAGAVAESVTGDAATTFGSCQQIITMGSGSMAAGHLAADLAGVILLPGNYTSGAAAIALNGKLTLDANDLKDAHWNLEIGGAFTTAAVSEIEIINGAGTVNWDVVGAITTGALTKAPIGHMKAVGAITIGEGATCASLETVGAITIGAGATASSSIEAGAVTVGAGASIDAIKVAGGSGAPTMGAGVVCTDSSKSPSNLESTSSAFAVVPLLSSP